MSEDFEGTKDDLDKELPKGSEGHSDYKPADTNDANVKHQLSGMYQNWFLDYASYVILERAVPHIMDGLKPVQRVSCTPCGAWKTDAITRWQTSWDTPCSFTRTVMPASVTHWCNSARRICSSTARETGGIFLQETAQPPPVTSKRAFPNLHSM